MQFHRVPTNVQKHRNLISFTDIHVYNNKNIRQTCGSNKSVQIWRKAILRYNPWTLWTLRGCLWRVGHLLDNRTSADQRQLRTPKATLDDSSSVDCTLFLHPCLFLTCYSAWYMYINTRSRPASKQTTPKTGLRHPSPRPKMEDAGKW